MAKMIEINGAWYNVKNIKSIKSDYYRYDYDYYDFRIYIDGEKVYSIEGSKDKAESRDKLFNKLKKAIEKEEM